MTRNDPTYPTQEATVADNALSPNDRYADATAWSAIVSAARHARECRPPAAPVSRGCLTASSMAAELTARYYATERAFSASLGWFPFPAVGWSTLLHYGTQHGLRTGTRDTRCGRGA